MVVRDTLPGILDMDARACAVIPGPDRESSAAIHGVTSVQDQVQENLLQFSGITCDDERLAIWSSSRYGRSLSRVGGDE